MSVRHQSIPDMQLPLYMFKQNRTHDRRERVPDLLLNIPVAARACKPMLQGETLEGSEFSWGKVPQTARVSTLTSVRLDNVWERRVLIVRLTQLSEILR